MSEAGVASRARQLCGDVVARLHSHGIEVVPFITVGCLVVGFWCVLSLPAIDTPREAGSRRKRRNRPRAAS